MKQIIFFFLEGKNPTLTLSLRKTDICVFFWTILVLPIFYHFLLLLENKTKLIKFCFEFQVKQANRLLSKYNSLVVWS